VVAGRAGCPNALLIQRASDIPWDAFDGISSVGITAGASAPEALVDEVIAALRERFDVAVDQVTTANERIAFNVPRELREPADA
jgi:4-hydroxy-3-methylbut-2-enyl diphosphate reductase